MRVSVIIPCYNAERYLEACLASVLAQTMKDFEVLVINDGSGDGSLSIARRAAERDARVRVFHQENRGVCAARNKGLEEARGEFVTFVDADDLLEPIALERMLGESEGADMVVCLHRTFDERGNGEVFWPEGTWTGRSGEARGRAAALRLIEGDSVLNIMCCKLHRRALIEREGLRLQAGVKIAEDALFNLEAVLCGHGIAYVNRVAYRYRMHGASAMHAQAAGELARHRPWLLAMRDMLLRRGQMESYFAAYVDSAALRLYKDGGVPGVVRRFNADVLPLLPLDRLDESRLPRSACTLLRLCRSGAYPRVYPLIYPVQVLHRKLSEAAFALRKEKEMPK